MVLCCREQVEELQENLTFQFNQNAILEKRKTPRLKYNYLFLSKKSYI